MNKAIDNLQSLKFRSFYLGFRAEPLVFWILCAYILVEYIRPQSMYPVLAFLPWAQLLILGCVASVLATGSKARDFGAMEKMFTVFSILVFLSGVFAWDPALSSKQWSTYTSWVLMYFCLVSVVTTPARMLLFVLFFILINFKLSQHGARSFAMRGFSFTHWGLTGSPGWFHNSGEFALQMGVMFSISLSVLLALKKHVVSVTRWRILFLLFPGTSALCVIGSSSRGGQLALVAVLLILLSKGKRLFRNIAILAVLIYAGLYFLPEEQMARFDSMGDDRTSELRLMHWENARKVIKNDGWGIGYFNWIEYYRAKFDPEVVQEIHNTVLQAFVELGYLGGCLFHLMIFCAIIMNIRTKSEMQRLGGADADAMAGIAFGINLGLVSTFIAAFFMSVLYYPMYWLAFALTSSLRHISKLMVKEAEGSLRSANSNASTFAQS